MANLLGQNIGTNYKGILNLNTLNGNLSGTLQAVTDGDGNASPLQLSTTLAKFNSNLIVGGAATASARLHVKGAAASNSILIEDSSGQEQFKIESNNRIVLRGGQLNINNQGAGSWNIFNTSGAANLNWVGTGALVVNSSTNGITSYSSSVIFGIDSTTKGFLPPRMTNTQMTNIATPATGLVVYDTTNNKLNVYDGTNWVAMH